MTLRNMYSRSWCVYAWCYRNALENSFIPSVRCASSATRSQEQVMNVFDRKAKRIQRDRTAMLPNYQDYEYIKEDVGYWMYDRLCDIKREFNVGVDLGCGRGYVSQHILKDMMKTIYQCEFSEKLLRQANVSPEVPTHKLVVDEEFLPFKKNSIDVFFSSLSLHWVNDLPGCFRQVLEALKPDGVFLGSMFGGETLFELRVSLQLAEQEIEGGFGPHVSPFTETNDLGNLLNRAGFTMLTLDVDEVRITYPGIMELMYDLKGMGENNCAFSRKAMLHRKSVELADKKYREMYGHEDGITATYQILNFIGWKPDPSQPKPLERGSAEFSLKDIGKLDELNKEIRTLQDELKTGGKNKK